MDDLLPTPQGVPPAAPIDLQDTLGETLVLFTHRLLDFREAELQAVAERSGLPAAQLRLRPIANDMPHSPLRLAAAMSDAKARELADYAVLVKGMYEVWGAGNSYVELKRSVWQHSRARMAPWLGPAVRFKWVVDMFGNKMGLQAAVRVMNDLTSVVPFEGPVDLQNPDVKVWLMVVDTSGGVGLPRMPFRLVLAREIAHGDTARARMQPYKLTERRYLGPTSMDHELAFVMCNAAHVRRGALVFDPFAGTGSVLVAAAARGAACVGADIDVRVIRDGRPDKSGVACNVYTNFRDYRLPDPAGLLRMDAGNAAWRPGLRSVFDAVLCDPPYGVRAGGRTMRPRPAGAPVKDKENSYIPSTAAYTLGHCLRDLLDTSARLLCVGGRLVYWMPDFNTRGDGGDDDDADDAEDNNTRSAGAAAAPRDGTAGDAHPARAAERAAAADTCTLAGGVAGANNGRLRQGDAARPMPCNGGDSRASAAPQAQLRDGVDRDAAGGAGSVQSSGTGEVAQQCDGGGKGAAAAPEAQLRGDAERAESAVQHFGAVQQGRQNAVGGAALHPSGSYMVGAAADAPHRNNGTATMAGEDAERRLDATTEPVSAVSSREVAASGHCNGAAVPQPAAQPDGAADAGHGVDVGAADDMRLQAGSGEATDRHGVIGSDHKAGASEAADHHDVIGSVHRDPRRASRGEEVPQHPCLRVLSNSVQVLSTRYVRRLIVMEKVCEYDDGHVAAWLEAQGPPAMAIDSIHDVVYETRQSAPDRVKGRKRFRGKTQ